MTETVQDVQMDSDDDIFGPSDDEESQRLARETPNEIYERLEQAWINEKVAPELLYPKSEEVNHMMEQIKTMEENILHIPKGDMRLLIHKTEMQRIKFVVTSYLRTRLAKIQEYCWQINEDENRRLQGSVSKLTPEEHKFLKEYLELLNEQLTSAGTSNMPDQQQQIKANKIKFGPEMDSFVFFQVKDNVDLSLDDAEGRHDTVELRTGNQFVMRYRPVSELVKAGAINLM